MKSPRVWVIALIAFGALRIASTYTTFSEGYDEPIHLAAGIEMLTQHKYEVQLGNPPLPRLVFALGPWLDGLTLDGIEPVDDHLPEVFQSGRSYLRTLVLSRGGNLIFFLIATVALFMWARREAGEAVGIAALLLFTTQPLILGWFGVVNHDGAATAGVALALLAFSRWLELPTATRTIQLGLVYGFASVCKMTSPVFIAMAYLAILLFRRTAIPARAILPVPLIAAAVIAVVYAPFGIGKFFVGLRELISFSSGPWISYWHGHLYDHGIWWYFPAGLALKSTIPFMILVIAGFFVSRNRAFLESMAAAAAMLLVILPTHLNIGVRYALPAYVPLSVAAAVALVSMFRRQHAIPSAAAALLICWHLLASAMAHPDYFPYFNEIAGRDPSRYLIDSNLDWGQDILRLSRTVRDLKIDTMGVALFGNVSLEALKFPPHHVLNPFLSDHGWIAVSDHMYRKQGALGGWRWLNGQPYRRIGKSIRLYHI